MKRSISPFGLLLTSVSAIIGSGWLFSAFFTSKFAGPASLLSWVIGGAAIIIVAFVFAELCAMIPVSGSSVRIPQFTHGSVVSFLFAWMIWLSYLSLMAIEVQAAVQYASYYFPSLVANQEGLLSRSGYWTAIVLMLIVSFINFYSVQWLIRCNNFLTIIKIVIPTVIATVILFHFFNLHSLVHPAESAFLPQGIHGVLGALSAGGILFAFNGFKQAAEMAGEVQNPHRAVPFALIGSVLFCLCLYLLLQSAFNLSLLPKNVVHGWQFLSLADNNSPLISILAQDQLTWLLPLVYVGAFISPLAASFMYCSSSGRSLAGMSRNGYMPSFFQKVSSQGNPVYAILLNFLFGICLFAPLPGWDVMMSFLTSLLAITYAVGPVCLLTLRYQVPHQSRTFKLPFGAIWSTVAFYICTLLAYFAGWQIISKLGIAIIIGLSVLFIQRVVADKKIKVPLNWRESIWLWPYLAGITFISYIGDYGGGRDWFSLKTDLVLIAILCIIIMVLAVRFRLPDKETENYIRQLHLEREDQVQN